MKQGNHGSCILSNLLEVSHKYALLLSTLLHAYLSWVTEPLRVVPCLFCALPFWAFFFPRPSDMICSSFRLYTSTFSWSFPTNLMRLYMHLLFLLHSSSCLPSKCFYEGKITWARDILSFLRSSQLYPSRSFINSSRVFKSSWIVNAPSVSAPYSL